jgi:hypothetical protein
LTRLARFISVAAAGAAIALLSTGRPTFAPILYRQAALGVPIVADVQHVDAGIWTPGVSADQPAGNYLLDLDADVQSLRTGPGYDAITGLGVPGPSYLSALVS